MGTSAGANAPQVTAYSWVVLFMLFMVYLFNQWDRYLINYLWSASNDLDAKYNMQYATHTNKIGYSWLIGPGFTVLFIITGLFVGRAADVFNRKVIITIGLIIWSLAIVGQGLSQQFWHLLVCRIILGIGQACSSPASYSIIASCFPEEKRGTANGLFSTAIYFGGALSSLTAILNKWLGWRIINWSIGGLGVAFAVIFFFVVREPARASKKKDDDAEEETEEKKGDNLTTLQAIYEVLRHPVVLVIFATTSLRFMGGYVIAGFLPKMYSNTFPNKGDYNLYLLINALVVFIGGMLSANLGGLISDKWAKTNPRARGYVPAIGTLLAIPCMAGVCLAPVFLKHGKVGLLVSLAFLFFEYLFAECFFGCVFATLTSKVAPGARALASSTFMFTTSLCGSLAPVIIGPLDNHYSNYFKVDGKEYAKNKFALCYIVCIAVCSLYFISACGFFVMGMFLPSSVDQSSSAQPLLEGKEDEEI